MLSLVVRPWSLALSDDDRPATNDPMIAFLTLEIQIEAAQSLKDRRQVVRSLKDRLRTSFNISVAELDSA